MSQEHHLDALVVGTGFAGIYALYSLRKKGLNTKAIDRAGDIGGTWYWNRYPGALSDTWSHLYRYSFDRELLENYPLSRKYLTQPEVLEYLRHVVEKYDLRKHMQFDTAMTGAKWDDRTRTWAVRCKTGDVFHVKYLVMAVGLLHTPNTPDIPGIQTFQGEAVHTASWPVELSISNRRVGVIGTSSTGIQVVTAIAPKVKSLHVFVRRPQYTVPSGDQPWTPEELSHIRKSYPQMWSDAFASAIGMGFPEPARKFLSLSPADRSRILEDLWQGGSGLRFMFGGFADLVIDEAANEEVCQFLRGKIAGIVRDPQKRAVLTPKELYARRPLCDGGFYEAFNRENVFAVDVQKHPITEVTRTGIRTADGEHYELDVIVFATGFDAMDGSYAGMTIEGRGGGQNQDLYTQWRRDGPATYLGMFVAGFPNLFLLNGPNTAFANVPPLTETNVDFLVDIICRAEEIAAGTGRPCKIEPTPKAQQEWTGIARAMVESTLFAKVPSWIVGKNVPGKLEYSPLFLGGLGRFRSILAEEKERGYQGFVGPLGGAKTQAHL
ncbi:hypothetical protein FE257_011426 [Aspergillus nanangensis]|uniref:Cyclohexanone monooxygenase n=1 Tax=Aspergillus nanangensis TaxID=2582783 RepID=A0AAD4CHD3_ASPNN|nr:hypothetical protein FE257_011426 [Aspergillus nanangensis]